MVLRLSRNDSDLESVWSKTVVIWIVQIRNASRNKKSLKIHGNTKHQKNICNMCSVKSKTAIDLIQHKEKHQKSKEFIETITDHNKEETNTKFVFSESMLDEILKLDAGDELDEFLKVN